MYYNFRCCAGEYGTEQNILNNDMWLEMVLGCGSIMSSNIHSHTQISASDVDSGVNSLVRYSILDGNQDHCFTVDEDSGIVTLMKKLDREKVSTIGYMRHLWKYDTSLGR